jgi:UDP-hydrolysing UDP-N-acetyl-D-glucosamine 2-epimerase
MRRIGIVTTGRADYGLYQPVARALAARREVEVSFYVTGMHLSPEFGRTVERVEADGWPVAERIEALLSSDSPAGVAASMGLTLLGFGQAFGRNRPDLLLVLGDRFEMFAAGAAALPYRLPIAHVHGGELSFGALDETFRHALTKMGHLHFTATQAYADRVIQLGEAPWRVTVSGAPGLDHVTGATLATREQLAARTGLDLTVAPAVVTLHPETASETGAAEHARMLTRALERLDCPVVITLANADAGGRAINAVTRAWAEGRRGVAVVDNLGTEGYLGPDADRRGDGRQLLKRRDRGRELRPACRQCRRPSGRTHARRQLDRRAVGRRGDRRRHRPRARPRRSAPGWTGMANPYGDGRAGERIAQVLADIPLDDTLLIKRFHDLPGGSA